MARNQDLVAMNIKMEINIEDSLKMIKSLVTEF